jgi:hypothetical protein
MPAAQTWCRLQERKQSKEEISNPKPLHTSWLKKFVASNTSKWTWMNSRQVTVFLRSGAGEIPCRFRIFPTV